MSQINDSVTLADKVEVGLKAAIPGHPDESPTKGPFDNLFVLWYMERPPHIVFIYFRFDGDFKQAIAKAQRYCTHMRYRFVTVKPFMTDLDREMRNFLD